MLIDITRFSAAVAKRYTVNREIGSGGMATVYLATDLRHNRNVALKVLAPELAAALGVERFLREIETVAQLNHPHILTLITSGEADGFLYFVMPFVEGESLRELLDREGRLPVDQAVRITREVADGLAHAHRHDIVHRDIKPGNIMLSEDHAVITDFGIARAISEAGGQRVTQTGWSVGSPTYMSPEQAGAESSVDGRSDIYSLGCMLYEMLAGEPPFSGSSARAIIGQHMVKPAPAVRAPETAIPTYVRYAVDKALAKEPAERFQAAKEFRAAISPKRAPVMVLPGIFGLGYWFRRVVGWRRAAALALLIGIIGTAIAVFGGDLQPGQAYAVPNPRMSYAIPEFRAVTGGGPEQELASRASFFLARTLEGWDSVRVAGSQELSGAMGRLGLERRELSRDDAVTLARAVRVGSMVLGEAVASGDSVYISVYVYDVASGDRIIEPIQAAGTSDEIVALMCDVADRVLSSVRRASGEPVDDRATELACRYQQASTSYVAVRHWMEGLEKLARWELREAADLFELAISEDSAFALPYHYLAVTLTWLPQRFARDSIRGLTTRAVVLAQRQRGEISTRDFERVLAFNDLQNEAYSDARRRYHGIIAIDSTDFRAWFQLGNVETRDRSLSAGPDGTLRPTPNLNLALRAYLRSVRIEPGFYLGYGRFFGITDRVVTNTQREVRWCWLFEPPPAPGVSIDSVALEEAPRFCPVVLDSIVWAREDSLPLIDRARAIRVAAAFEDSAMAMLRAWARLAPDLDRPHRELAARFLTERGQLRFGTDTVRLMTFADSALLHVELALAISGDSSPERMARLGSVRLAAGDFHGAQAAVELAVSVLRENPPDQPPNIQEAANVYMALGQATMAAELASQYGWTRSMYADVDGRFVSFGGAETTLDRIHAYGSSGVARPELSAELGRLWAAWAVPDYGRADVAGLADNPDVRFAIEPALLIDSVGAVEWTSRLDSVPLAWRAFASMKADSLGAIALLRQAVLELDRTGANNPTREYYVLAVLAQQLGQDSVAIDLLGRLAAWPHLVRTLDGAWGLLSRASELRARSFEALGDTAAARQHYERFIELWADADPPNQPLVQQAREAVVRLR